MIKFIESYLKVSSKSFYILIIKIKDAFELKEYISEIKPLFKNINKENTFHIHCKIWKYFGLRS